MACFYKNTRSLIILLLLYLDLPLPLLTMFYKDSEERLPLISQNTRAVVPDPTPAPVIMFNKKLCSGCMPFVQSIVTNRFCSVQEKNQKVF